VGVTQVHKSLWTPTGEKRLEEKGVSPVTRKEIIMLSELHEFAFKQELNVFCKRCEQPIRGQNNDSSRLLAVECQCRTWIYDAR
jgi:hypothetical protein